MHRHSVGREGPRGPCGAAMTDELMGELSRQRVMPRIGLRGVLPTRALLFRWDPDSGRPDAHSGRTISMSAPMFICAAVGCLLGLLACNTDVSRQSSEASPVESLAALGTELNLRFPPSTRLIGVHRWQGMDDIVHIKLELAPEDLDALIAQTQIDPAAFTPGTAGLLGPDQDFWDPHRAPKLRTAQAQRPDARALNLGIDDSRPAVAVVYLVEHGT
jgi:hypothetical protein